MTIYELLKNDHNEVKRLFKKAIKFLPDQPQKALSIFNTIKTELVSHAKAEENVFYVPLFKNGCR